MAGRFVRSSKYRHIFGRPTRKEQCYDNLHISKNAWDSNIVKANPLYLAVNWESGGGGAFAVIPLHERGRAPEQIPLFRGHTAPVLDTDWSPFNDSLIASGSEDGKIFIWTVPQEFSLTSSDDDGPADVSPVSRLAGHSRKVGHVLFHPVAENALATSSGDYTVKLWDIERGDSAITLQHPDLIQSMCWSGNGSLMVTTCRDKTLRIWDPRQKKAVYEGPGHSGIKISRAVWMGDLDRIATTGFSKSSERQLGLWDIHKPNEPISGFQMLDSISGVCMPFWDDGTKCLYLAGKGDGNIRYFEYASDGFVLLSEYKSVDPQRGVAFIPKRGVALHENEVMRAFKTVNDTYIEPISFIVPRRAETFQNDIYPPAPSGKPGLTAEQWYSGSDGSVPLFDLESIYSPDGTGTPQTITKAFTPSAAAPTAPGVIKTTPAVEIRQVSQPIESAPKPSSPVKQDPLRPSESVPPTVESASVAPPETRLSEPVTVLKSVTATARTQTESNGPMGLEGFAGISSQLEKITALLEAQSQQLASQSDQIADLTKELDTLKTMVKGNEESGRKDEIIRKLELELEQARS